MAVGSLVHPPAALALGFGPVKVHSALNQPLDATLTLASLTSAEKDSLSVGVASPAMFERFGIERTAVADELNIDTAVNADRAVVHLTTRRPVREPFLRLLLEARTSGGKSLREYTVLLDPPGQAPDAKASSTPAVGQSNAADVNQTPSPRSQADAQQGASGSRSYGPVARGDNLYRIASKTRHPGMTLAQMEVAIYRANPKAFNGSINVLLQGAKLTIPSRSQVAAIDKSDALAVVRGNTPPPEPTSGASNEQVSSGAGENNEAGQSGPSANDTQADTDQADTETTDAKLRLEPASSTADISMKTARAGADDGEFGRLVQPDFSALRDAQSTPAGAEAAAAKTTNDPGDSVDNTAEQALAAVTETTAQLRLDAISGVNRADAAVPRSDDGASPGASVGGDDGNAAAATVAGGGSSTDGFVALSSSRADVVGDVAGGLLRPRNLLLMLLILLLLAAVLARRRRREYQPVPLGFESEDDDPARYTRQTRGATGATRSAPRDERGPGAAVRIADAQRQMNLRMFDNARDSLETGLAEAPTDSTLQDKLLELDYQTGDAEAFKRNVDRFYGQLAANGVRWAGIATMGRILSPDDARFANDDTARGAPPASPAPATEARDLSSASERRPEPVAMPTPDRQASDPEPDDGAIDPKTAAAAPAADHEPPASSDGEPTGMFDAAPSAAEDDTGLTLGDGAQPITQRADRNTTPVDTGDSGFELDTSELSADDAYELSTPRAAAHDGDRPAIDTGAFQLIGDADDAGDDQWLAAESDGESAAAGEDNVQVRLDLARMYLEMADHETARELLEEVIRDGDEAQQQTARDLTDRL